MRTLLDFGRANLIDKARQQPEKVKKVLNKVKTDGLFPTLDAVRTKLDQAMHLGYANAGTVEYLFTAEGEFAFLELNPRLARRRASAAVQLLQLRHLLFCYAESQQQLRIQREVGYLSRRGYGNCQSQKPAHQAACPALCCSHLHLTP